MSKKYWVHNKFGSLVYSTTDLQKAKKSCDKVSERTISTISLGPSGWDANKTVEQFEEIYPIKKIKG